jgi:hypothetical protein
MSRSGDARDAAAAANITAAQAVQAAHDAQDAAVAAGCALNTAFPDLSPYNPPAGYTCP